MTLIDKYIRKYKFDLIQQKSNVNSILKLKNKKDLFQKTKMNLIDIISIDMKMQFEWIKLIFEYINDISQNEIVNIKNIFIIYIYFRFLY